MNDYKFTGSNYDSNLGIKEIAKKVREKLKDKYPNTKWSIRIQRYAGGCSLSVDLMEVDFDFYAKPDKEYAELHFEQRHYQSVEAFMESWEDDIKRKTGSVNQFYIDDDFRLSDKAKELLNFANDTVNSYNFDDSDSMTDYFHVNFYLHLGIGKWDKPLIINKSKIQEIADASDNISICSIA